MSSISIGITHLFITIVSVVTLYYTNGLVQQYNLHMEIVVVEVCDGMNLYSRDYHVLDRIVSSCLVDNFPEIPGRNQGKAKKPCRNSVNDDDKKILLF